MIGNPLKLSFAKYIQQEITQLCSAWPIGQDVRLYVTMPIWLSRNYALMVHFASLLLAYITLISFKGHAIVSQKCMMMRISVWGPCHVRSDLPRRHITCQKGTL